MFPYEIKIQFMEVFKMANINVNELTKEQIKKARTCKTAEELMAAAKAEGFDLTQDEAEAYMAELSDIELDEATLQKAAGGFCYTRKCSNNITPDPYIPA